MDIQAIKLELIQWLTELNDRTVIEQMLAFKKHQSTVLSAADKILLDERITSYEQNPGQAIAWEEVVRSLDAEI